MLIIVVIILQIRTYIKSLFMWVPTMLIVNYISIKQTKKQCRNLVLICLKIVGI